MDSGLAGEEVRRDGGRCCGFDENILDFRVVEGSLCQRLHLLADDHSCQSLAVGEGVFANRCHTVGDSDVLQSGIGERAVLNACDALRQLNGDELLALVEEVVTDDVVRCPVALVVCHSAAFDGGVGDVDGGQVAFVD